MEQKAHARLAPSASKRWLSCPGSIALCDKVPPQADSSYAIEGTNAHTLGEKCLKEGKDAAHFIGKSLKGRDGNFKVDEEMAEAVQVYVTEVTALMSFVPDATARIEERFDLSWLHTGMFGSNDACVYDPETKTLHIFDYKHGAGVVVEPEWNSQLMIYAIGAMHSIWSSQSNRMKTAFSVLELIDTVRLVIVQPRAFHADSSIRSWEISASDLMFWARNVLKPGAIETEREGARLSAGDHCRFCPAIAVCPEQIKRACEVAKVDFEIAPLLPSPDSLTPNDLAKVMAVSELFGVWSSEVKAYAQAQAESGFRIPGYKLVARRAERKWVDEEQTSSVLEEHLNDAAYNRKLLSVAQAEKALKKAGLSPEAILDGIWEKPDTGVTLVPEDDKRREVESGVSLEFLDTADFLQ